jgi:hypothetical protein
MSERPRAWKRTAPHVNEDGVLHCPHCGNDYIHQQNTTIFARGEDADWTTVIAQDGENVQATRFPSSELLNPSTRRHGMLIEFWCEHCHYEDGKKANYRLAIWQGKGRTFIEWVE